MVTDDSNGGSPAGKFLQPRITFTSDTKGEHRFAAGEISIFVDVILGKVCLLLTPAAFTVGHGKPAVPLRALLSFDDALQLSHSALTAAARLHRAGGA